MDKLIMSTDLITIDKDMNLKDAMSLMEKKHISRLLVTEDKEIVGLLTEEDIANRLGTGRERTLKIGHIHITAAMTRDMVTITEDSGLREAARIMLDHKFSSLPVTRDGEIVALVTKTDLIKSLGDCSKEVAGFYTKEPISVNPNNTLLSARKLMLENNVHRLIVTDRGLLAGILTERDIAGGLKTFRKAIDKYPQADIKRLKVGDVMSVDPVTVKPETLVGEAVGLMFERKISGLPVIAPEFGILTKTDLVRGISEGGLP
ncbi:MAG: CBS domain-containing protein [Candidatus Altiarchaeota archaeon]|nr:CBS domain-containing protein [Candidatus Altiarchaeota archaeon]